MHVYPMHVYLRMYTSLLLELDQVFGVSLRVVVRDKDGRAHDVVHGRVVEQVALAHLCIDACTYAYVYMECTRRGTHAQVVS